MGVKCRVRKKKAQEQAFIPFTQVNITGSQSHLLEWPVFPVKPSHADSFGYLSNLITPMFVHVKWCTLTLLE